MPELKTQRPYQERFLDNFDRSQLRREVQAVKPRRFQGLRKKYATWALGATLAVGGIGAPLKMVQQNIPGNAGGPNSRSAKTAEAPSQESPLDRALAGDMSAAQSIAKQVASGVQAAASGVEKATSSPLAAVAQAPQQLAVISETAREEFFRKEVPFGAIIYKEAKKNNVRPELIAAVVQAESRFKPTARSGAGAIGLMQLVPRTGRWMGARDLTNPQQNVAAGAKYLKYLNERFDGNETKVIAAYNAGEGNVKRFGGVPPFKETRNYVAKVRDYEKDFKNRVDSHIAGDLSSDVARAEAR
ncbi:MAG TPA: lytic transglycosylase domain-containing protein [Thermoanaerobaculia bacterium]|nr:lytic transglycosylase domain-containing protein [Thermoanaerobaculia bacterium]